jgi:hypothetical protein
MSSIQCNLVPAAALLVKIVEVVVRDVVVVVGDPPQLLCLDLILLYKLLHFVLCYGRPARELTGIGGNYWLMMMMMIWFLLSSSETSSSSSSQLHDAAPHGAAYWKSVFLNVEEHE